MDLSSSLITSPSGEASGMSTMGWFPKRLESISVSLSVSITEGSTGEWLRKTFCNHPLMETSGGSKGAPGTHTPPPGGPNSFIFMQFSAEKIG